MYILSRQALSQVLQTNGILVPDPDGFYKWKIVFLTKDFVRKRSFFVGNEDNNISGFDFELNKKICGAGQIEFTNIDIPIEPSDYIEIYYNDVLLYFGMLENTDDVKKGKLKIVPIAQKYKERFYNGSFTTKTLKEIAQTIVESLDDSTGILWNDAKWEVANGSTRTIEYKYRYVAEIFDDIAKELDCEWGIDETRQVRFYDNDTLLTKIYYVNDNALYTEVTRDVQTEKIDATCYQVYRKDPINTGTNIRSGEVGYSGGYPSINLEQLIRKKESKITVPDIVSNDTAALDFAYAKLQAQKYPESIKVSNFDMSREIPAIGERYRFYDVLDKRIKTLIDCESITNWSSGESRTIATDDTKYIEGTKSIKFSCVSGNNTFTYNLNNPDNYTYFKLIKIGLYFRFTVIRPFEIRLRKSDDTLLATMSYEPSNINEWNYIDFVIENITDINELGKFEIFVNATDSIDVNVDKVCVYGMFQDYYEGNVTQINFKIDSNNDRSCNIILNDYELAYNKEIDVLSKKIDRMHIIQEA